VGAHFSKFQVYDALDIINTLRGEPEGGEGGGAGVGGGERERSMRQLPHLALILDAALAKSSTHKDTCSDTYKGTYKGTYKDTCKHTAALANSSVPSEEGGGGEGWGGGSTSEDAALHDFRCALVELVQGCPGLGFRV
jgi:hypothetical protein